MSSDVSARDLRNHTRDVLKRVANGEPIRITVNRRPVAELHPVAPRVAWVPGSTMEEVLRRAPADAGMLADLAPLRGQLVDPE